MGNRTLAVCVGDNCVDHYLPPLDHNFSGGNAVNVAVYLQKTGYPSAYVGSVGDDADGRQLLLDLKNQQVDTTHVRVLPGKTAYTHVRLTPGGDRQFILEENGPALSLDEDDLKYIRSHRLIHNTWQGGTDRMLPSLKQGENTLISMDYGERYDMDFVDRTISAVDIAFFSQPEDSPADPRELARKMSGMGPRLVVVTIGYRGSIAYDGRFYDVPAEKVQVVDTLGAGDAYMGVFLATWLQHKNIPEAMSLASKVAAQACTHLGAW